LAGIRRAEARHQKPLSEEPIVTLAQFIIANSKQIIAEWEEFARLHLAAASRMDLKQRRDHIQGMLIAIARDLETPQTKREQASKATGDDDASVGSDTAANAHGTDRAGTGFSPIDVVSEFRALRASVLRLWSEAKNEFSRDDLVEATRFNEAIDQQLVESMTRYTRDVEHSKDLFLGVLSHDLRNPLGAIMMSATLMMTADGAERPHLKAAGHILNAGARMDTLIGDLLDFTRTRLGSGIPIARKDVDLETICRQTVDEMTAFHPHCVVNFKATGDLHGKWDAGRIAQALSNLCGNAFQHGTDAPIGVTLRGEDDHVVISVHNRGHQIPENRLHDIFDPFKQLDPGSAKPKDAQSVGLGLYIVQAIVTAHDGTVDVESNARGTTFTMQLPRAPRETTTSTSHTEGHSVH
jgi:signal transduction histidine kinase